MPRLEIRRFWRGLLGLYCAWQDGIHDRSGNLDQEIHDHFGHEEHSPPSMRCAGTGESFMIDSEVQTDSTPHVIAGCESIKRSELKTVIAKGQVHSWPIAR